MDNIVMVFMMSASCCLGLLDAVEPALDAGAGILNLLHALDKGGNGTALTMRHIALLQ